MAKSRLRKRSGRRRGGRLTKAEIRKAGGLKQAWAARKAGKKSGGGKKRRSRGRKASAAPKRRRKARAAAPAAPKRRRRKSGSRKARKSGGKRKSAKRVAAGKKAARTRKRRKAAKAGGKRRRKSGSRKARRSSPRRRRRSRKTRRAISFRVPRKTKKVYVVASERRRRRRRGRRHHRGHSRRHGAMENPLNGAELFVGSLFGLVGFLAGDFTDRLIATHALVDTNTKSAAGLEVYSDTPSTTGAYAGLYNPTAICAPMNVARWANAVGAPAFVFIVAHFVKSPLARSSMQFAAFGYGARTVGKGLIDGLAMLVRPTKMGQQLYSGEMRAMALKSAGGNSAAPAVTSLPTAGLGQPRTLGAAPCKCGGKCANCQKQGVGYPSMPREVASTQPAPTNTPPAANAPAPPPGPAQQPAPAFNTTLTGPKSTYKPWGDYQ